jgi:hypothetical protein
VRCWSLPPQISMNRTEISIQTTKISGCPKTGDKSVQPAIGPDSFCIGDAVGHLNLDAGLTAEDFEYRDVELDLGAQEPFGDSVTHEKLCILYSCFHAHDAALNREDAAVMKGIPAIFLGGFREEDDLRSG